MSVTKGAALTIRNARLEDLDALHALENVCFDTDRLSRRRLRHWIMASNREFMVAENQQQILGYGLVLFHEAGGCHR